MPGRRTFLGLLAAGLYAPAASGHTLYGQWLVYRQKHLLIGCHRGDLSTWDRAREVVAVLEHLLPEAAARAARAPHPGRIASLIGTRQLELAVLTPDEAAAMQDGTGAFSAYGPIPLNRVMELGDHVLVGHPEFPSHHGWLVAAALDEAGYGYGAPRAEGIAWHPGTVAFREGVPLETLIPAE